MRILPPGAFWSNMECPPETDRMWNHGRSISGWRVPPCFFWVRRAQIFGRNFRYALPHTGSWVQPVWIYMTFLLIRRFISPILCISNFYILPLTLNNLYRIIPIFIISSDNCPLSISEYPQYLPYFPYTSTINLSEPTYKGII